jgi:hypothetical protein
VEGVTDHRGMTEEDRHHRGALSVDAVVVIEEEEVGDMTVVVVDMIDVTRVHHHEEAGEDDFFRSKGSKEQTANENNTIRSLVYLSLLEH